MRGYEVKIIEKSNSSFLRCGDNRIIVEYVNDDCVFEVVLIVVEKWVEFIRVGR